MCSFYQLYLRANAARQLWDADSQSVSALDSSKDECFFLRSASGFLESRSL